MSRVGLTRDRVVRAGAELADEVGFEHVTLSALARRLGVQVPSLYSHVGGLEDLRSGVALLALQELADVAGDALAGRAGADALSALGAVFRDYAAAHPGRYDAARHDLDPATAAASAGPRLSELTRAVLRDYRLSETDQTHAVRLLGSFFHGFVALERAGGFSHSAPASEESWQKILASLDALLRSWPTDPARSGPDPRTAR